MKAIFVRLTLVLMFFSVFHTPILSAAEITENSDAVENDTKAETVEVESTNAETTDVTITSVEETTEVVDGNLEETDDQTSESVTTNENIESVILEEDVEDIHEITEKPLTVTNDEVVEEVETTEAATEEVETTEAATEEVETTEAATEEVSEQDNVEVNESADNQSVTILHTNDIHGRLKEQGDFVIGMPKVKTIKERENADFLFDAGDIFQGLPISNYSKGEAMAEAINGVGYDAIAVGNHEFDFGFDQILKLEEIVDAPLLSSNVRKDGELVFKPYVVLEKYNTRYGVIGVTTPETAYKTHPDAMEGVTFDDPYDAVSRSMLEIYETVDNFIIVGHLGIDPSTKEEYRSDWLMEQLQNDARFNKPIIFIDGHSHSTLENGMEFENGILVQAGSTLSNIGKVTFDVNENGQMENIEASLIHAADVVDLEGDAEIEAQLEVATAEFEAYAAEVVIPDNSVYFEGERENVRTRETNLGNMIADAMEQYADANFIKKSDFAITNGGGIREPISTGEVTVGDVISVLPFGNTIAQLDVTGQDVWNAFEHSLSAPLDEEGNLTPNGAFLHVSNSIRVYYDLTQEPGSRVTSILILNDETNEYEPIDLNQTYTVTTNDFLAVGGDGYDMFAGYDESSISLDEVFMDYLKNTDLTAYEAGEAMRIMAGLPEIAEETETYEETQPTPIQVIISDSNINKDELSIIEHIETVANELSNLNDDITATIEIIEIHEDGTIQAIIKVFKDEKLISQQDYTFYEDITDEELRVFINDALHINEVDHLKDNQKEVKNNELNVEATEDTTSDVKENHKVIDINDYKDNDGSSVKHAEELPNTGQANHNGLIYIGTALFLLGSSALIYRKRA